VYTNRSNLRCHEINVDHYKHQRGNKTEYTERKSNNCETDNVSPPSFHRQTKSISDYFMERKKRKKPKNKCEPNENKDSQAGSVYGWARGLLRSWAVGMSQWTEFARRMSCLINNMQSDMCPKLTAIQRRTKCRASNISLT
jgi:hypothetical protein